MSSADTRGLVRMPASGLEIERVATNVITLSSNSNGIDTRTRRVT
jgi:hypothetical protein